MIYAVYLDGTLVTKATYLTDAALSAHRLSQSTIDTVILVKARGRVIVRIEPSENLRFLDYYKIVGVGLENETKILNAEAEARAKHRASLVPVTT